MNIWSGAIALDEHSQLRGLQLIDRSAGWQSDVLKDSTLTFRSFVNPALVPLYARVGPNLEFHTNDPETSRWLKHKLLGNIWLEDDDLDRFQTIQCPVGFLVSLDGATRPRTSGPTATDLLVYGVLSSVTSFERLLTPPESSSPESGEYASDVIMQELRIYATPISGSLIAKAQALPDRQVSESVDGHEQTGQFLPDLHSPGTKRKRVETLFESVAQHHKKVQRKGGEAVSLLMAHSLSQSSQQLHNFRFKRESEEPTLPVLSRIASHRSRSLSISSNLNPNKGLELRAEHPPRPSSNRGHARGLTSKRSTPAPLMESSIRKERISSPAFLSSEGKEPPSTPQDADTVILENKNTITRTILTCMRLYGFNRTAPRPASSNRSNSHSDMVPSNAETRDSQVAGSESMASCNDEDEFKAMYHATYRASTFALRKYLREPTVGEDGSKSMPPILEKAKAMTYIDEFLRLFCEEEH